MPTRSILITSAYDWVDIEAEARSVGNGFLQKPLFKSTLCNGIQRYLTGQLPVQNAGGLSRLKGKRILLVEDNLLNQEIAVELLSTLGTTVESAADGAATRRIRRLPRQDAASIPIIAMTADAFAEDVEAAKKAGMNSHLPKPFDLHSLSNEICRFI